MRSIMIIFVFSLLVVSSWCEQHLRFPSDFKFGAATSSYQVEGALNAADRADSTWDVYIRADPTRISDLSNASTTCDSYHLWRRDVEMATELGLQMYRFSISWPRLLPNGFANKISDDGRKYYDDLINGLLAKGIEPLITLYHYDLPQKLQDFGGWTNPLISDWFADYARVVYSLYGDRVNTWITINEPVIICDLGYGGMQPLMIADMDGMHLCTKNVLLAHAKAWRIYDEEFKHKYHGKVSIANLFFWFEPKTEYDAELTELAKEYSESRIGHAIYSKEGGWPPKVSAAITEYHRKTYAQWSLPAFSDEEIRLIKGTYDYYALNHYITRVVTKADPGKRRGPWPYESPEELELQLVIHPDWKAAAAVAPWFQVLVLEIAGLETSFWRLFVPYISPQRFAKLYRSTFYPEGLRKQLSWLRERYGDIEFMITENGYPSTSKGYDDYARVDYMREYLYQLLVSMKEDGTNVTGYVLWALMDNFEWSLGYSTSYGLYNVDFSSPLRTRTPRASARYYSRVIATRDPLVDVVDSNIHNNLL